jgi:crotonobetainyl-CoA:carnitine CoA-transferase CaiB-like acyl-CoA transferase
LALNRGVPAVQLADLFGGAQQAVIGVLAALVERARSGQGRVIDVAMTEGATGFLLPHVGEELNVLDGTLPCYRVYACARGAYALGALEPKFWLRFCEAVGRTDWSSRAFDRSLVPELDALFAARSRDEWAALLHPFDCCGEPVLEPSELRMHPLFEAREVFSGELLRTFPALVPTQDLPRTPPPALGEHTAAVLRDWVSV